MKAIFFTLLTISSTVAFTAPAPHEFKFTFKSSPTEKLEIKQQAANKELAFKLAAKECFNQLTGGKYPGEERGLDIIDICANPKM